MRRVTTAILVGHALLGGLGGSCGAGDGGGGGAVTLDFRSPRKECYIFASPFPPGFAFVPGRSDRVWAVDFSPPTLIPLDVAGPTPVLADDVASFRIPRDSDGDGVPEGFLLPPAVPDGITIPRADLGLVTASGYDEVLFLDPASGGLRTFEVSVPPGFRDEDFEFLPAPGTAAPRTAVSSRACVRPPPGAPDSRGDPVADSLPGPRCDPAEPSYRTSFTSGAALVESRLFVSTSNLGSDAGRPDTQFLPGTVLAYDVDLAALPLPTVSPNATAPVIFTTAFNPTHVTAYEAGGRSFVLVSNSGAIGIEEDDPGTPAIEAGTLALTDAAIDVIDARTLELVATIPLGRGALDFERLAIDPSGRVAVVGSAAGRMLFAVDLLPLPGLPERAPSGPVVLTESVIFDAAEPLRVPDAPDGAPPETCAGQVAGYGFDHTGEVLLANDYCDGSGAIFDVDLSGSPPVPVPQARFVFREIFLQAAPLRADTLGEIRGPGPLEVRPGRPGIDFTGSALFTLMGDPGLLCAVADVPS